MKRTEKVVLVLPAFFLSFFLASGLGSAQTTVRINFGFPYRIPLVASPESAGHSAASVIMMKAVLKSTLPKAMIEAAGEYEEEVDEAAREDLSLFGSMFNVEHFSNDLAGKDGNVYGLGCSYERQRTPFRLDGVFEYKLFDMEERGRSLNANRIAGIFAAAYNLLQDPLEIFAGGSGQLSYTIHDHGVHDYTAGGGGAYVSLGRDFTYVEFTIGASYLYTKYDISLEDDSAHLVKYGFIAGVPLGNVLAANVYFTETRNPTDYERELLDKNYFTLGTEMIVSVAGTWVVAFGYRTILDYTYYSSHQGYLGTMMIF